MVAGRAPASAALAGGGLALALLAAVVATAAVGLASAAGTVPDVPWAYVRAILGFTLLQAGLSTALALGLGAMLALALARRAAFPGRRLAVAFLDLAFLMPAIVVIFGVVAVWGRSGLLGGAIAASGVASGRWLYGLPGILLAHVAFNAPFAARVFLAALETVPGEHWRLAAHLGMGPGAVFRLIDRPVLAREAPGVAGLVFLLCFASFPIVLALGGGPGAATLEVAIYEAILTEADFGRAAILAAVQVGLCLCLVLLAAAAERRPAETAATGLRLARPDAGAAGPKCLDAAVLAAATVVVALPALAVAARGVPALASLIAPDVARALATSLAIALPAGLLATGLALGLAALARRLALDLGRPAAARLVRLAGFVVLVTPPIALAAGLFAAARPLTDPFALGAPLIVLVNALVALPFALRRIEPPLILAGERYGRLAESLGIAGLDRLRLVDGPLVRPGLAAGLATAMVLSFGDLGVAAFFGTGELVTLPVLLYQRLGAYRMDEAAAIALLLGLVAAANFAVTRRLLAGAVSAEAAR